MQLRHRNVGAVLAVLVATALLAHPSSAQQSIKLPAPHMSAGRPLVEALAKRQSTRTFSERALSEQILSDLLWAAFGINRPESGDHTAPSWRGSKEIDIYVAMSQGVWLYDAKAHELRRVMDRDIRAQTSSMVFVRIAPVLLIYAPDRARMAKAPEQEQLLYAHVDAALVAQNVYLFAASAGLGIAVLGSVDRQALAKTLGLRDEQIVTFALIWINIRRRRGPSVKLKNSP